MSAGMSAVKAAETSEDRAESEKPVRETETNQRVSLVLATHNPGKMKEFRERLAGVPVRLWSAGELGLRAPEETGTTYRENAEIKARGRVGAMFRPAPRVTQQTGDSRRTEPPGGAYPLGPGRRLGFRYRGSGRFSGALCGSAGSRSGRLWAGCREDLGRAREKKPGVGPPSSRRGRYDVRFVSSWRGSFGRGGRGESFSGFFPGMVPRASSGSGSLF